MSNNAPDNILKLYKNHSNIVSMNVWKIASRWSNDGNPDSSVLHLFRQYNLIFAYDDGQIAINNVKTNDLVAISDGSNIVSIAKVLASPKLLNEFNHPELEPYNEDECTIAMKVKITDLNEREWIYYGRRGRFHALHDAVKQKILLLWQNREKRFSIDAKSCTLKYNNQQNGSAILGSDTKYIVPIFQRPYSWGDAQIRKFISDLFVSFWGTSGQSSPEPLFIGTMQLSEKKLISKNKFEQEVIDGQQRLTTLILFLKILKKNYQQSDELESIKLDWLETRVNNGQQQQLFAEFLHSLSLKSEENLNKYIINANLINELVIDQTTDEEGKSLDFNINAFVNHILSNVYFVIIETYAGLSKTLQIFNAINTTGLDLNGGDIFKIRMYEYLKDIKGWEENAFIEISNVYEKIETVRKDSGDTEYDIRSVLSIYQYILIAKFNLPNVLYSYGSDTFFERLFDNLLNITHWDHFANLNGLELSIDDLNKVIDTKIRWENLSFPTVESSCLMSFIYWSRYSRYEILVFLFIYRYFDDRDCDKNLFLFLNELSKLLTMVSVLYAKAIGEIHTFIYSLVETMINGASFEQLMIQLRLKINGTTRYKGDNKPAFIKEINSDVVWNAKMKNLLCRLAAMLDEEYKSTVSSKIAEVEKRLFNNDIDIEHIQAFHDLDESKRDAIWKEWGVNINSIGNLVILEQYINRSCGNKPYLTKRDSYLDSEFTIVQNLLNKYQDWSLTSCMERKSYEIDRIVNYLFNNQE